MSPLMPLTKRIAFLATPLLVIKHSMIDTKMFMIKISKKYTISSTLTRLHIKAIHQS